MNNELIKKINKCSSNEVVFISPQQAGAILKSVGKTADWFYKHCVFCDCGEMGLSWGGKLKKGLSTGWYIRSYGCAIK